MTAAISFLPPIFGDEYDGLKMRSLVAELERLHAELIRSFDTVDTTGNEINDLGVAVVWDNVPNANITVGSVTQHVAAIDHDSLLNFTQTEHFTQAAIAIAANQTTSGTFADALIQQSNVTQHEAALTILESQITDANILARIAGTESITGQWDFTRSRGAPAQYALSLVSAAPFQEFDATGAAANEGSWAWGALASSFVFRTTDDSDATGTTWLTVNRTGATVDNATFGVPILATSYEGILATNILSQLTVITGQTELTSGLASTDELLVSDGGTTKRMDVSVIEAYMQANIDHDSLTNFLTAEHVDWAGSGTGTIHATNVPEGAITQHEAAIDHDALTNFLAAEHVDWAGSGTGTIHATNVPEGAITQHEAAIDHDALTNFVSGEHFLQSAISIPGGQITAGTFGGDMKFDGELLIKEMSPQPVGESAYGVLWVKDETPNELWFTNDASQDFPLVSDVVSDASPQLGGNLASNGFDILMADGDKVIFGDAGDMQMFNNAGTSTSTISNLLANAILDFTFASSNKISFDGANKRIDIRDGWVLRIRDTTDADFGDFSHDGTDFNTAFDNNGSVTTDWNITGIASMNLLASLIVRDTGSADHLELQANATNCNFLSDANPMHFFPQGAGVAQFSIDGANNRITVGDGNALRIAGSVSSNFADFSHDNTDFNTAFTSTIDWNLTGITALRIAGVAVATLNTNWSAADITSGTLLVARGGTGVTSKTGTGNVVLSATPTLTGNPIAPTQSGGDNSTRIATTAYVQGELGGGGMNDLVDDTSPELGGDLNTNGFDIAIDAAFPMLDWNETDQAVDEKRWRIFPSSGQLVFSCVTDDGSQSTTIFSVSRTLAVPDQITFQKKVSCPQLDVNGAGLLKVNSVEVATVLTNWATGDITSGTFANTRIAVGNVTQHEASIDHDALANFLAAEHVDWAGSSAGTIHVSNFAALQNIVEDASPVLGADLECAGKNLQTLGVILMKEQAAADADVAAEGQLWVKTRAPNDLYFTQDTGVDKPVSYAKWTNVSEDTSDVCDFQYMNGVYFKDGTVAKTLTLEASSVTTFEVGSTTAIINAAASADITITEGASTTLFLLKDGAKTDTAGGCTLGPGGYATLYRHSTTVYFIMGDQLTA